MHLKLVFFFGHRAEMPILQRKQSSGATPCSARSPGQWNIPNLLSGTRLVGAPGLLIIAWNGLSGAFLWVFSLLLMTDWLDGRIARSSQQQTTFGARLDSIADATTYSAALLGAYWLKPEAIGPEIPLVMGAASSYVVSVALCLVRFRRMPTYHTAGAKLCWALTAVGVIGAILDISIWPLRIAMGALVLANVEAMAITLLIPNWRPNVMTLYHALRKR